MKEKRGQVMEDAVIELVGGRVREVFTFGLVAFYVSFCS